MIDIKDFNFKLSDDVSETTGLLPNQLKKFIIEKDNDFDIISKSNLLYDDFLKKYIHTFDWNFDYLILNNKISLQFILDNFKYFKNYKLISKRIHHEYEKQNYDKNDVRRLRRILEDTINNQWDFNYLSKSGLITMDFIEENLNKNWNWQFNGIIQNPNLTFSFIKKFINKPWDFDALTLFFDKNNQQIKNTVSVSSTVSFNSETSKVIIPLSFIEKTIDKPWDFKFLSNYVKISKEKFLYDENKSIIPLEFVYKYRMLNWDFTIITKKFKNVDKIEEYLYFPWIYKELTYHVSPEFIKNNLDKNWDFNHLSKTLDLYTIISYPDLPWNDKEINKRQNFDNILKNHSIPKKPDYQDQTQQKEISMNYQDHEKSKSSYQYQQKEISINYQDFDFSGSDTNSEISNL